ncbi:hypothetical protein PF006_g8606 [Phytophthora fragariae]|uniref:Peptidase S74 domain-containing protein n=2 Tax=Phytophthora fragariae TaxID=53985 RepID=A0A6A3U6N9_9STRA|nr:hypothetical protein PF006_g8606 [Phytophthora fragariae]
MFTCAMEQLGKHKIGYLAVLDGDCAHLRYSNKSRTLTAFDAKTAFKGVGIANNYMRDIAEGVVRSGGVDLVGFGRLYITNPDLVERFQDDWPYADALQNVQAGKSLELLSKLTFKRYEFEYDSVEGRATQLGIIGPELQTVVPEAVQVLPERFVFDHKDRGKIALRDLHVVDKETLYMHNLGVTQRVTLNLKAQQEEAVHRTELILTITSCRARRNTTTGCHVFRPRFVYIYRHKEIEERTMRTGKSTRGKAWTSDEVLVLVTAWKHALAETLPVGHTTDQFNARVYDLYVKALCELRAELSGCAKEANEVFLERAVTVSSPEGGLAVMGAEFRPRSERAIKDKMESLRQTFTLISDHNSGRHVGSTGKPACGTFEDDPSVHPVNGGVEVGAVETEASTTPVPPDTTTNSKKRTRDAADIMNEVMDKAAKAVREASHREFEEYIKHQENENEKTRALLRELFGGN